MNLAWLKDHVKTMAELAKYTEPDEEVKSSSVWELVEKEQNRRWEECSWIGSLHLIFCRVNLNISKLAKRGAGPAEEATEANRRATKADWGNVIVIENKDWPSQPPDHLILSYDNQKTLLFSFIENKNKTNERRWFQYIRTGLQAHIPNSQQFIQNNL